MTLDAAVCPEPDYATEFELGLDLILEALERSGAGA
jgi:hypothetical protein